MKDIIAATIYLVALCISIAVLVYYPVKWQCGARWKDFSPEFAVPGGCMIKLANGKRIHASSYRTVNGD